MARLKVKIDDRFLVGFKKLPKELAEVLDEELYAAALEVETESKQRVPVDTSVLKNSSSVRKNEKARKSIYSVIYSAFYAAYVEFGTVTKVYVPEEMSAIAAKFKGSGRANNGGMRARPFLYPAFKVVTRDLPQKIDKALQTALDKLK